MVTGFIKSPQWKAATAKLAEEFSYPDAEWKFMGNQIYEDVKQWIDENYIDLVDNQLRLKTGTHDVSVIPIKRQVDEMHETLCAALEAKIDSVTVTIAQCRSLYNKYGRCINSHREPITTL